MNKAKRAASLQSLQSLLNQLNFCGLIKVSHNLFRISFSGQMRLKVVVNRVVRDLFGIAKKATFDDAIKGFIVF